MMVSNLFYTDSYYFLRYYYYYYHSYSYFYYHFYFFTAHGSCVRVVLVTNSNILLVFKKLGIIIFNNFRLKFFLILTHKFQTKTAPTLAHDLKNSVFHIEFTVHILYKSIISNSVIFSFLSYCG